MGSDAGQREQGLAFTWKHIQRKSFTSVKIVLEAPITSTNFRTKVPAKSKGLRENSPRLNNMHTDSNGAAIIASKQTT